MNATPLEIFRVKGIPHRRMEDWKYSDLRQVLDAETVAHAGQLEWRIAKLPEGVEKIAPASFDNRLGRGAMNAAAWAFAENGIAFRVPRGMHVGAPIDFEFLSVGHGHVALHLERDSSAMLLEEHGPDGHGLRNVSFAITLEEGAALTHVRRAPYGAELVSIATMDIEVGRNARYRAHFASHGSKLSRTELHIAMAGEGAAVDLSGVNVLGDGAHADITTHIDHKVGHTASTQLFKTVAAGKSRSVYQGKITVREGADVSDSRQTAKGLLLGARAEIDLKPELEIFADDVKCAHGAAVGDLDTDSLFYLRSRGIPEADARALLIHAFLEEVIDGIEDEKLREEALKFVDVGLARAMKASP